MRWDDGTLTYSQYSNDVTYLCANSKIPYLPLSYLVPDAPAAPTISLGTLDLIIVNWDPPASDGGSSVLGY